MARLRHMLLMILAVVGLLVAIQPTSARAGCPMDAAMAMPTMHHHDGTPAPMSRDLQNCPVCLGVLPSPPAIQRQVLAPVALFTIQQQSLFGIDSALDPPPPRGA